MLQLRGFSLFVMVGLRDKSCRDGLLLTHAATLFRFAPSPNGYLHLGHAYSALLNFDLRGSAAENSCCASRISTRRAVGRNTRRRSTKTSPGSHRGNAGAPAVRTFRRLSRGHRKTIDADLIYPSSRAARRSRGWWKRAKRMRRGRATRRRAALSGYGNRCRRPSGSNHGFARRCAQARHGSRHRRAGRLCGPSRAPAPPASGEVAARRSLGRRHPGAQETPTSYHLRRDRRCAAGRDRRVRGEDLFVHQRAPVAAAIARCTATGRRHHRLIREAGEKLSSRPATGLRELRAAGASPADIRQLVGLP